MPKQPKKKTTPKTSTPKKRTRAQREPGDTARVIRKRFEDEAKRYERQAKAKGTTAAERRYLNQAAAAAREQAEQYKVANLRSKFGKGQQGTARIMDYLDTVGRRESEKSMYKNLRTQNAREQRMAERILSGSGGSAFYAGTVQIWRGKTGKERNEAILEFFGKKNLWEVLQYLEEDLNMDFFDIKEYNAELYRKQSLDIMERVIRSMSGAA